MSQPSVERDLVIMTKSSKNGGFCVAGLDLETKEWIRLISEDEQKKGAVADSSLRFSDGQCCKPLDVVQVSVLGPIVQGCQRENYYLKPGIFKKKRTMRIDEVVSLFPPLRQGHIFLNNWYKLEDKEIRIVDHSLLWAFVKDLEVYEANNFVGSPRAKAKFIFGSHSYSNMSITDPDYFSKKKDFDSAYIVVSLPDTNHGGYGYFKFVSKIFPIL